MPSSQPSPANLARLVAIGLLATVVTQLLYVGLEVNGDPAIAWPIWRSEAVIGLVAGVCALALLPRLPLVAAGLAVGSLFNVLQAGIGLWTFDTLFSAGEAVQPVAGAVLALAFFLYHAAKAALAVAALGAGAVVWRADGGAWRWLGLLAGLAGLVALVTNLYALSFGREATWLAGAAGTVATLLLALVLTRSLRAAG